MEYIDKNKSREWAHELIKEFLKDALRKMVSIQRTCMLLSVEILNLRF